MAAQQTISKTTGILISSQQAQGLVNSMLGTDDAAFIADMASLISYVEALRKSDPEASRGCGVGVRGCGRGCSALLSRHLGIVCS